MICPACGRENLPGADYCADCNTDLFDLDRPRGKTRIEAGVMGDSIAGLIPGGPLLVSPQCSVREAIGQMIGAGRNCTLVVEAGRIVGIFTERDVLLNVGDGYDSFLKRPVGHFMTPNPECLRPTDTVAFGLNRMMIGDYRHLPIVQDGKILGVVSVRDILGYLTTRYPDVLSAVPSR